MNNLEGSLVNICPYLVKRWRPLLKQVTIFIPEFKLTNTEEIVYVEPSLEVVQYV